MLAISLFFFLSSDDGTSGTMHGVSAAHASANSDVAANIIWPLNTQFNFRVGTGMTRVVFALSVLLLLMGIYFVMSVATEVFVDEFIKPSTLFSSLLVGTILSGVASLAIDIDTPSISGD